MGDLLTRRSGFLDGRSSARAALFIDEFGTIGADVDNCAYGFATAVVVDDGHLDDLRETIRQTAPNGFHGKTIRRSRKAKRACELVATVADDERVFLRGTAITDPGYGRDSFATILLEHPSELRALSELLEPDADTGLLSLRQVTAPLRVLALTRFAMFLPITELCREFPTVTDWQIDAYFGQIGDKSRHATQLVYSLERGSDGLTSVLRALVETGRVTRGTKVAVQTDFASSEDPLFWFADGAAHLLNARLRARRPDLFNEASKNDAELAAQLEMVFGPLLERNATTTTFNFGPGMQVFPSLSV